MPETPLSTGSHHEYVLGHVIQALSEDPRAAELDVQVRIEDERVVIAGCVTTEEHRAGMLAVVRELLPGWQLDDRIELCEWGPPDYVEAI